MKICKQCNINKEENKFYKRNGICKKCYSNNVINKRKKIEVKTDEVKTVKTPQKEVKTVKTDEVKTVKTETEREKKAREVYERLCNMDEEIIWEKDVLPYKDNLTIN